MAQLDLDGFETIWSNGYKCKLCLKFFTSMQESSKHQAKHVKHRRKKKTLNHCLENFRLEHTVNYENRYMPNIVNLGGMN